MHWGINMKKYLLIPLVLLLAGALFAQETAPGLYANDDFQGDMGLVDAINWVLNNAENDGQYLIVLGRNERAQNINLRFTDMQARISLRGSGTEELNIEYATDRPARSLFTIGPGATLVLEDGIALIGLEANSHPMIRVEEGGTLIMNGGSIRGNTAGGDGGGGVYMFSGTFTMNGGTISGNTAGGNRGNGGGVLVREGTFTMNGGIISGNTARSGGGGVYVTIVGVFIKHPLGSIIYGNDAPEGLANSAGGRGHAVDGYANNRNMIRRNTTAGIGQALSNSQSGAPNGWE